MFANLQQMACPGISHGDDAGLLRQRLYPVRQPVLCILPIVWRRGHSLIDNSLILFGSHQRLEGVFTLLRPLFSTFAWQSVESKTINALFFQVSEGRRDQGVVVGSNVVHRWVFIIAMVRPPHADDRHSDILQ
ncbi:hypothetical protein D3C71_1326480 [compost metagenome]